jgi:hypothetical protein
MSGPRSAKPSATAPGGYWCVSDSVTRSSLWARFRVLVRVLVRLGVDRWCGCHEAAMDPGSFAGLSLR